MNQKVYMHAILLHGMGRTPIAMSPLAARLKANHIRPHLFAYSVTFERWDNCKQRLEHFIKKHVGNDPYIMIGHSMGSVLTRAILPGVAHKPSACFFLSPPTRVCKIARLLTPYPLVKILGGEFAQLLANEQFMDSLDSTGVPMKIYAGIAGPRGRHSPFGEELNDGVLTIQEASLPGIPLQMIPILHPFIINSKVVSQDIIKITQSHDQ